MLHEKKSKPYVATSGVHNVGDSPQLSVMVADDHGVVRAGIAALLVEVGGFSVVGEASDGIEAVNVFRDVCPDVVLMDLRMPRMGGVEAIAFIKRIKSDAAIVILTTFDGDEDIFRAMRAGARGYILKDDDPRDLFACIRAVYSGQTYIPPCVAAKLLPRLFAEALTEREAEVLSFMAKGESNKAIGDRLRISEVTVKTHIANILDKLDATSRTEAVSIARRRGLISD